MNCAKKCSGTINNNKNKLISEIIYNFNPCPNAHYFTLSVLDVNHLKKKRKKENKERTEKAIN